MVDSRHLRSLSDLIAEHGSALELFARQWVDSPEDIVQQAFVDLLALSEWPARPIAWLHVAVRNRALNELRRRRRRQRHANQVHYEKKVWFTAKVDQQMDAEQATIALQDLPPQEREAVIARIWGQLTFEEIATLTKSSASTAFRRYESGLARLRSRLSSDPASLRTTSHDVSST